MIPIKAIFFFLLKMLAVRICSTPSAEAWNHQKEYLWGLTIRRSNLLITLLVRTGNVQR